MLKLTEELREPPTTIPATFNPERPPNVVFGVTPGTRNGSACSVFLPSSFAKTGRLITSLFVTEYLVAASDVSRPDTRDPLPDVSPLATTSIVSVTSFGFSRIVRDTS